MNLPVVGDEPDTFYLIWQFFGVRVTLLPAVFGAFLLVKSARIFRDIARKRQEDRIIREAKIWRPHQ